MFITGDKLGQIRATKEICMYSERVCACALACVHVIVCVCLCVCACVCMDLRGWMLPCAGRLFDSGVHHSNFTISCCGREATKSRPEKSFVHGQSKV